GKRDGRDPSEVRKDPAGEVSRSRGPLGDRRPPGGLADLAWLPGPPADGTAAGPVGRHPQRTPPRGPEQDSRGPHGDACGAGGDGARTGLGTMLSEEAKEEIRAAMARYPNPRSALMPALYVAQREAGGWLS